jgi:hypothetical protein
MSTVDWEPAWKIVEEAEAELARLKALGGDKDPNWEKAVKSVERARAYVIEHQRIERAKPPEEPFRTDKRQLRQEDADWIEDGGWSGKR